MMIDEPLEIFAFHVNLRRYGLVRAVERNASKMDPQAVACTLVPLGKHEAAAQGAGEGDAAAGAGPTAPPLILV